MGFSKLHSSLVNSSLWTQPDSTRILFITLLALCDRSGVVCGSKEGISRIANISPDDNDEAWSALMSPDPDSSDRLRNPENEGRRVEEVAGGFRLLNYGYYRGLRNEDDRREQNRLAQERFQERQKAKISHDKPEKATVSPVNPMQRQKQKQRQKAEAEKKDTNTAAELVEVWNLHRGEMKECRGLGEPRAKSARARLTEHPDIGRWAEAIQRAARSRFCTGKVDPTPGHKRFFGTFDWLVKPETLLKIEEGLYDDSADNTKLSKEDAERLAKEKYNEWARAKYGTST